MQWYHWVELGLLLIIIFIGLNIFAVMSEIKKKIDSNSGNKDQATKLKIKLDD